MLGPAAALSTIHKCSFRYFRTCHHPDAGGERQEIAGSNKLAIYEHSQTTPNFG